MLLLQHRKFVRQISNQMWKNLTSLHLNKEQINQSTLLRTKIRQKINRTYRELRKSLQQNLGCRKWILKRRNSTSLTQNYWSIISLIKILRISKTQASGIFRGIQITFRMIPQFQSMAFLITQEYQILLLIQGCFIATSAIQFTWMKIVNLQ